MTPVTVYGVLALSFMMAMYALEHRGRTFILAFASGAWPFGVVEAIWCVVAVQRFRTARTAVG